MLSIDEALRRSLQTVIPVEGCQVLLHQAYGRVLLEDVAAQSALPPWDNSAMDGFAVQAKDTICAAPAPDHTDACADGSSPGLGGPWLDITETIAAGSVGQHPVKAGQAARIMTGAPMPAGADAVVMVERTTTDGDTVQIHQSAPAGQHIREMGSDVPAGTTVLFSGQTLTASAVGLAAAVGRTSLVVARQLRVGIVATGSELVTGDKVLGPGQIYSANTAAIMGMVLAAGAIPVDCGIAPDTVPETRAAFVRAMDCDLIISTGGVSVGDFDHVKQAMSDLGAEMQFFGVKVKPGKPLALGIIGTVPAFGLPGNPVSAQVGFLQFVRPWIRKAMGCKTPFLPVITAKLTHPHSKRPGRAELCRVILEWKADGYHVSSATNQSSGSARSMVVADGLMLLGEARYSLESGDTVAVQLLNPSTRGQANPGYPW